ncbi:multiple epidermal growth factor-like domains protein 10 [Argopecten irradians]|uniref:multiple epidermal growth factor-like domains protein 10 n=1 Tax=Argopecten irradians TaxID=31199 RepID=UPI00371D8AB9
MCDIGYFISEPCGGLCCANAYCNEEDNKCYCNKGYYGVPTVNCYKPCKDLCGTNSYCGKHNTCYCNDGFYGNPYFGCYPACHGLCKTNAKCDIPTQKCVCNEGFFGNPYKICEKPGIIQFEKPEYSVIENVGVVVIKVIRTGSTYAGVHVTWTSHDVTAKQGSDYIGSQGKIYFGTGVTSVEIIIPITNDMMYEKIETFSLSLTFIEPGAVFGQLITTVVSIEDNDAPCGGPCPQYSKCDPPSQKCVCIKGYIKTYYGGCELPCKGLCCANAYCDARDNRCKCNPGYWGIGTVKCFKPCNDACGSYALCGKDNKCYCEQGYYGNPYKGCYCEYKES